MAAKTPEFPVVGVGASAGGLDAYKRLLGALPNDTGAAFILIQHLDPNHESLLADLLSKHTSMPVIQAENDTAIEANSVYVIPPNKFIKLVDHGLFLDEPVKERGMRMSIDYFFRSMAEARAEKAIAILLSGTGSDGTLGIREIKEAGGMIMVQSPDTADYDGMPRSAIATGAVDFILPIEDMPEKLAQYITHPYLERTEENPKFSVADPDHFKTILNLLRAHTDYDFISHRRATLERRIHRRMGLNQLSELGDYVKYLRENREEVDLLFRDFLIAVTRFFRDPESWEKLQELVLPKLTEHKASGDSLRAWVPGCASGEEAYTLAITIFDWLDRTGMSCDVQIFATDLNPETIAVGRAGAYPSSIAGDVPPALLDRFFIEDGDKFRVNKRLRETVVFATQNVISDPPFSKLDIITCRNLMIYLEADIQQRMIEMFHFALAPGGFLFLGSSESAERPTRVFEPVSKSHRIYRRGSTTRIRQGSFPIIPSRERARLKGRPAAQEDPGTANVTQAARALLLTRYAPASVVVNARGEIQYYQGPLRNYLGFPEGEPTHDLASVVMDGLKSKLRALLSRVADTNERTETVARNVRRNGHEVSVRISAEPVPKAAFPHFLVCFEDASEPRDRASAEAAREKARDEAPDSDQSFIGQLEYELKSTKEDLQSTIEEMETANEELKASNEEVMSMNEELQSTNEELETSREELQSLNEELSTVNSQLEDKIDELESTTNDLVNLLASTDIATIFLDTELRIRRFTPASKELLRIIDTDIGRPIEDLTPRVKDPTLLQDVQDVLKTLQPREAEVESHNGAHFVRRIRPYRTSENRIEGVVLTFTDVTNLSLATERVKERSRQQEAVAQLGLEALAGIDLDDLLSKAVAAVSERLDVPFVKVLQLQPDAQHLLLRSGIGWTEGLVGTAMVDAGIRSHAGYTLQRSTPVIVDDFATEERFTSSALLSDHKVLCGISVIIGPIAEPWGVLGAHSASECDFTADDVNFLQAIANMLWLTIAQKRARQAAEHERLELRQLADALPMQISIVSPDERYVLTNQAYKEWGVEPEDLVDTALCDLLGEEAYATAKPHIDAALAGELQRFELTVIHPERGPRTNLVTYAPRLDAAGNPDGFFAAAVNITSRIEAEQRLAETIAELESIYSNAPVGLALLSPDLTYLRVNEALADINGVPAADHIGKTIREVVPDIADMAAGVRDQVLESREPVGPLEIVGETQAAAGEDRAWLTTWSPVLGPQGDVVAISVSNTEITERKREEERIRVISAELDHRVKNILATVMTIARMTGQSSDTIEAFRHDFEGRIHAMARTHATLAEKKWHGMRLEDLVRAELAPYYEGDMADRLQLGGPDLVLRAGAIQPLSLALHELATNAAKYGALSRTDASLTVQWQLVGGKKPRLQIAWTEDGLTGIEPPQSRGFGSRVIEQVVATQLEAEVDLAFLPTGVRCLFAMPQRWVVGN